MTLVCRIIGESCGQLTYQKNANFFSEFGLSTVKPSRLVNGYNKEAKMVDVRLATTIQNLLNIACGPTRCWGYDLGKNYTHYGGMRHGRLDFNWLCYMVVFAKECVDMWSVGILLNPHSAQNPLDIMDNDRMYANLGITNMQKAQSTVASIGMWNIWKYVCLKWY